MDCNLGSLRTDKFRLYEGHWNLDELVKIKKTFSWQEKQIRVIHNINNGPILLEKKLITH